MLQVKERLGDFEILRLLGKGGMGEVYEARQFNPERRVALKVLAPWLADDKESLERFLKEAKVPANLDHPGIVRIITTGTDHGIAYYTMHLVRGISLSEMIRKANVAPNSDTPTRSVDAGNTPSAIEPNQSTDNPPASPAPEASAEPPVVKAYRMDRFMTVARIGAQAARALAFAHEQGVLHRDIKPSNLMVDFHNYVYLVDFGLTRALEQRTAADSTLPGTLIGTPWYMSPEQADSKPLDARSDIYSLGVTLYELATQGLGPFTASRDNKQSVLAEVRAGKTLPLRMLAHDIPAALEQIILRAMQLKPSKRYASSAEMARDLEAFCGHSAEHPPHPAPKRAETKRRRRWPLVIGALLTALVAVSLVGFAMRTWHGNNRDNIENAHKPPKKKSLFDGAQAFPESLRDPKNIGVPTALQNARHEPVWAEYLSGKGKYILWPKELLVAAKPADGLTLLALADPDCKNFEFNIIANYLEPQTAGWTNEMGIFFGWQGHLEDSDDPAPFFVLDIDGRVSKDFPLGQARLGLGRIVKETAKRAESSEFYNSLRVSLPLRVSLKKPRVYQVKLTVHGDQVTLAVDNDQTEINVADLRKKEVRHANLNATGVLGVWTRGGHGAFKKAELTRLKD